MSSSNPIPRPPIVPESTMIDLAGTEWRVEDLAGRGVVDGVLVEVAFGTDGTVSGTTGVNRFRGPYTQVDDRLTFGPIITTRMAGPPAAMDQEQVLIGVLGKECTVRLDEPWLLLDDGDAVTRLVAADASPADEGTLVVRGEALYREHVALLPGSTLTVKVEDVALADASSTVLAEQQVENPQSVPIPFELTVDRSAIGPHAQLTVRARITHEGRLIFASDTHNPVSTDGDPEPITVMLKSTSESGNE